MLLSDNLVQIMGSATTMDLYLRDWECSAEECRSVGLVHDVVLFGGVAEAREGRAPVWVLATKSVWPGDLSTFLWSQYGSTVSQDLRDFRSATCILLDEFTSHWRRQKIKDAALAEHVKELKSLSDLVLLDRLDNVRDEAGFAVMAPL